MNIAERQHGQVLLIFALMAAFIVGAISIAVDYGLLTNLRRNVQAYGDEAATAGASQLGLSPTPTDRTNARQAALIYLRDNLGLDRTSVNVTTVGVACNDTGLNVDLGNTGTATCTLPGTNYKVSIWSPSETSPAGQSLQLTRTVSVRVSDTVATALAGIIGFGQVSIGAFSVAEWRAGQNSPYALFSGGCLSVNGTKPEIIAGDIYTNECTIQSGGGALCTRAVPNQNGNDIFGPYATVPTTILSFQSVAGCQTAAAGKVVATGNIAQSRVPIAPLVFAPPPNIPTCSGTCVPAKANNACKNGSLDATGTKPSNCYDPGAYSTIGLGAPSPAIANNLNPGVYHISGDTGTTSTCYQSTTLRNCAAVVFGDNTMNANYTDVKDTCWALPNAPSSGTFSSPCPTGFAFDPTTPKDPQCSTSAQAPLAKPLFTVTPTTGGSLNPAGLLGTTYYVRVSAHDVFGESDTNELTVVVSGAANAGAITVSISGLVQPGTTDFRIYGPSLTPSTEQLNQTLTVPTVTGTLTAQAPVTGALYPLLNQSACSAGFHNIPPRPDGVGDRDYGVTFVLDGKASICFNVDASSGACAGTGLSHPVVLLSPNCALFGAAGPPALGYGDGTYHCPRPLVGPNIDDGAFPIFGATVGGLWASGSGAQWGMTGTVDVPNANLKVQDAQFEVIPGQLLVHDSFCFDPLLSPLTCAGLSSGNVLNQLIFYDQVGAYLPPSVQLLQ